MSVSPARLSRLMSHALRHDPQLYNLELDDEGWAPIAALLDTIHLQGPEWVHITTAHLETIIATSLKRRHEIAGNRIRALYGHSVRGQVAKVEAEPPARLFHGTSAQAWLTIQRTGLQPMGRQFVHLSVDVATAEHVGRRKAPDWLILTVDTTGAHKTGSRFWSGNEFVWLADHIAPEHLAAR